MCAKTHYGNEYSQAAGSAVMRGSQDPSIATLDRRCPTLPELPPAPPGRTGWPWTIETPQLPDAMPDGRPWPRISIVTPSYNQGQFIEETVRSVLLQGYPNLEYIVMDGGSADGSVDIIRKYEQWLTRWESGPDGGQARAINLGFGTATGQIMNWLNSDDYLLSNALGTIALVFRSAPGVDLYIGTNLQIWFDQQNLSHHLTVASATIASRWPRIRFGVCGVPQDAAFFSKHMWNSAGPLEISLNYGFDTHFFSKVQLQARKIALGSEVLSVMRRHDKQKTFEHYHASTKEKAPDIVSITRVQMLLRRLLASRLSTYIDTILEFICSRRRRGVFFVRVNPLSRVDLD